MLSAVLCALALSEAPSDWPRWRGADFDGTSREEGVFPREGFQLQVRWRRKLGSGYSGIAVSGGRAVTLFSDGERDFAVALDADSGEELWRAPLAPTYPGREGSNDGPVSTPAIAGGLVYALGPRGDLVALLLDSGAQVFRVHLVEELGASLPHWGFGTSPLVFGDSVIVETGGAEASVTALDRRTGKVLWRAGEGATDYQSPILWTLGGEEQLVAAAAGLLYGLDPRTGRELWRHAHGASGFYEKILNPVAVGPRALLLTHEPMKAQLLSLEKKDGEVAVTQQWVTPHLKLNYATPIHDRGHIYGFSGGFLTSVDATTGALNWKSRPPGNGFPILVDSHLVVLTKQGTLHVIEATPEAYREVASLEVLPHIAWTPPSFASGRIYVRDSFTDVAAVDIVPGRRTTPIGLNAGDLPSGLVPGTEFSEWLGALEDAADKDEEIRRFLSRESGFPLVEEDRVAHFVYYGEAKDVAVRGGMLGAKRELAMHRVPDTNLFHASFELPADARLQYQFVRDLDEPLADPRNPPASESLVYLGEISTLSMPLSEKVEAMPEKAGRLESLPFETPEVLVGALKWGGKRTVEVYLPPGYDGSENRRYPSIYFLYGEEMLRLGLPSLVDRVGPVIAVFVASTSGYEYARSQRDEHARMLVERLVPLVDSKYRTLAGEANRGIYGVDEGGFAALDIAFRRPGTFGNVAAHSVLPIGQGGDELLRAISDSRRLPLSIYLDWGRFDHSNDATETDIPGYGRKLRETLVSKGYEVEGREWNDSSDLPIWKMRAGHALRSIYRK
jgi:outer membrane protein assembly factor BamB/enterochelin esterase-like enzyme